MKKFSNPVVIGMFIAMTLMYMVAIAAHAQNVVQEGKTFIEQKSASNGAGDTKTEYLYQSKNGEVDTVYLSRTGKAFVWRLSKKGNYYKKYLPEIGRVINPKAYEERTDSSKRKGH